MIDVGEALTRKIGPLPVVAWGAIVGGGILVARALRGGGASSTPVIIGAESGSNGGGGGGGAGSIGDPDGNDSAVPTVTVPPYVGNHLGKPDLIVGGGTAVTSYDQPPRPVTIDRRHVTAAQRT